MRPRTGYRVGVIALPIAAVFLVAELVTGAWLRALVAAIAITGTAYNLVQARRIGVNWHGPATFRELQRKRNV